MFVVNINQEPAVGQNHGTQINLFQLTIITFNARHDTVRPTARQAVNALRFEAPLPSLPESMPAARYGFSGSGYMSLVVTESSVDTMYTSESGSAKSSHIN